LTRAPRTSRAVRLPALRLGEDPQARREDHRDAGVRAGALEGRAARTRGLYVPRVREDNRNTGALASDRARPGRAAAARRRTAQQVPRTPAAEPAERALRRAGHRSRRLDAG